MHNERRKFREACETAAATASTIFHTVSPSDTVLRLFNDLIRSCLQLDDDGYSSSSYMSPHSSSFHQSGSISSDDFDDDLYAFDERAMPRGSHRQRRRSSSVSFSSRPTLIPPNVSPYQLGSSVPIPIQNQPNYSYNGGSPYQPGSSPYSNSSPYPAPGSYPQQYPNGVQGVPMVGSPYDPNQTLLYQGGPGSYPQQTYIQAQPGMSQSVPMVPGSTIVIQQPSQHSSSRHKRHHKHRSSSRDGRRHRSYSEVYPVY